jgi:hypothetical protein
MSLQLGERTGNFVPLRLKAQGERTKDQCSEVQSSGLRSKGQRSEVRRQESESRRKKTGIRKEEIGRSHLKIRILAQSQGGTEFQPADILKYFEELKRGSNTEIGTKDFFEMASIANSADEISD